MELFVKTEQYKNGKGLSSPSLLPHSSVVFLSVLLFILLLPITLLNPVLLPPILFLCFHTN